MKSWRYLVSDSVSAAEGLAFDEAMMWRHGGDGAVDEASLRLYTYQPHCALVGRYQSVEDEIDLDYCRRKEIQVGRRPTGGGAIIMGPGQLGVAITAAAPLDRAPREVLKNYSRGVIAGLGELGIEAGFRSKNDLEVHGRKIAGLGLYLDQRGALLFHASVLVDLDVELMLKILQIPGAKLSDKAVARVSERVTTVSKELSSRLTAAEVRDRFAAGLTAALDIELAPAQLETEETAALANLAAEKYGHLDWIFQRSVRQDAHGTELLKTPAGLLRIHVAVHGDAIKSALLAGDFNVLPAGVAELEAALKWSQAEETKIAAAVAQNLDSGDLGVEPTIVAEAIWRATLSAQHNQRLGHPKRDAGSCYFPEIETAPGEETMEVEAT